MGFLLISGRNKVPATLGIVWLLGTAGCGGGGGTGSGSTSHPTALALGTPTSVTGSAADGVTFTFSEALTTLSGSPAVTYTLHEVNTGPDPVNVAAESDATTGDLFPVLNVRILDPQNRALALPTNIGSKTLTLVSGESADTSLTVPLSDFRQTGRYSITATSTGTDGVPALTTPLVLTAG